MDWLIIGFDFFIVFALGMWVGQKIERGIWVGKGRSEYGNNRYYYKGGFYIVTKE